MRDVFRPGVALLNIALALALPTWISAQGWRAPTAAPTDLVHPGDSLSGQTWRGPTVPVLLVPGWSDERPQLEPLRRRLVDAGWEKERIRVVEFEDPVGSNALHAEEIAAAVEEVRHRTGVPAVDVIAHSMGGLAVRHYLQNGGAGPVRRVAFLATPHRGTVAAHLAWGEGAREMEPGSRFLLDLARARPVPPGIRAITIRTPLDLHVLPPESATLPGVPDLEVCCPTHAGMLDDDATFQLLERFLKSP